MVRPQNQGQTDRHYTCTGNSKYGSGDRSEYAVITDDNFLTVYGYVPRSPIERTLMSEQILAKDRQRGR